MNNIDIELNYFLNKNNKVMTFKMITKLYFIFNIFMKILYYDFYMYFRK